MKLIRLSAVPRRGSSYTSRRPCARTAAIASSMSRDPVGELLQPGPERSRNFAIVESGVSGASSCRHGAGVADGEHRLADALALVGLLVHDLEAEVVAVEGDRLVEVGHGDADMVDRGDQLRQGTWTLIVRGRGIGPPAGVTGSTADGLRRASTAGIVRRQVERLSRSAAGRV